MTTMRRTTVSGVAMSEEQDGEEGYVGGAIALGLLGLIALCALLKMFVF